MSWWRAVRILLLGSLAGATTSSAFILVNNFLTRDSNLHLWEFGVILSIPLVVTIVFTSVTKTKFIIFLPVTYLTFFIPTLGAIFGSSGSEPFWQFVMLGLAGGLGWSIPLALWFGLSTR